MGRLGLAVVAGALGVTLVCGALIAVMHWTAEGLLTHARYNSAFSKHGANTLVLLPAVLLALSELEPGSAWSRPRWLLPLAWVLLGLQAVTTMLGALWWSVSEPWGGLSTLPLFAACWAVCAVSLLRLFAWRARDVALTFASIVQLLALGLGVPLRLAGLLDPLEHPSFFSWGNTFSGIVAEATALAAVAAAVAERRPGRGPFLCVAGLALAMFVPRDSLWQMAAGPLAGWCAVWLFVEALRKREPGRECGERFFAALAAFTFLESAALGQFLRLMGVEILDDTYFVVGLFHLRFISAVFALVAVARRRFPQAGSAAPTLGAGALCAVGSQVLGFAMLIVGSRGMPRRYYNYLPEFEGFHRAVAVCGGLLLLGMLLAAWPLLRRSAAAAEVGDARLS